ncbi:hypothetical protein FHY05_001658 [Sphingomonas sp. BK580]|nr:hypothetical protein [Sphingomonas sp. BK580]
MSSDLPIRALCHNLYRAVAACLMLHAIPVATPMPPFIIPQPPRCRFAPR